MNSAFLYNIARFILLLAAQILVFNNLDFNGYLNPYPYVLFVILYPVNGNRYALLLASFLLGATMDLFCTSGGVHTVAAITLAYLRPAFFRFAFGVSYEYQTIKINSDITPERFSFLFVSVITHHFILFFLETFKLNYIFEILVKTVLSTLFTLLFCILIIYLFKPKKR